MQIPKISAKGLLLLNFVSSASISAAVISPALPRLEIFYSLSSGHLEWIMSIFLIGYMLGQLIYGPLSDRIGRVNSLRLGMIIHLVGIVICYLGFMSHLFSVFLVGRFISALGASSGLVCAIILINESLETREAKSTFAYMATSFGLAMTLSILIGGMITQWLGWQYCFVFLFLHTCLLLIMTRRVKETYSEEMRKERKEILKDIQVSPRNVVKLICFSLLLGFNTTLIYCYTTAAPLISKYSFGLSPSEYSIWNLFNLFGMILGSLSAAIIVNLMEGIRIIRNALLMLSVVLVSFLVVQLAHSSAPIWFFVASSAMYFSGSWIFSVSSHYASNAIKNRALGSSIMSFVNLLSAVIGVIILGYLPFKPLVSFLVVSAIFLLIALASFTWIRREIKRA